MDHKGNKATKAQGCSKPALISALGSRNRGQARPSFFASVGSYPGGPGGAVSRPPGRFVAWPSLSRAFTVVELMIVLAIIVLILAIAIPGLSAMGQQARRTQAEQLINGMTTRAFYLAQADQAMTAVRFFPGNWASPEEQADGGGARQMLALYRYVGTTEIERTGSFAIEFREHFERAQVAGDTIGVTRMPADVWAAPIEAVGVAGAVGNRAGGYRTFANRGAQFVLNGQVNQFRFCADRDGGNTDGGDFLNADDFLIVVAPDIGVRAGLPQPYALNAFAPFPNVEQGYDMFERNPGGPPYMRYGFSGVVTYRREPFAALGAGADGAARQSYLREDGRPYLVHRLSGGLLPGARRPS
ncbi:MAG: prepilin-type N-terminal cleavage/methylation domain-containing protein [Phycisphaerales bacterium]|nr:prepilin-type N-terminal cleavage/methylation domain-containing protein [Phycisphaerales bacterium]